MFGPYLKRSGERTGGPRLSRWEILIARVDSGLVKLLHVPDVCMPADFLTKWTTHKKVRASINYLININNKVYHPNDPKKPG